MTDIERVNPIVAHWRYLKYVLRHKWYVYRAGRILGVSLWRLLIHDWTKLLPSEWTPYVHKFYRPDLQNDETMRAFAVFGFAEGAPYGWYANDRFNLAWLYHQKRNKHHWQYWVLKEDSGQSFALPMPDKYMREMVADWAGAGRAITGKWEVLTWYTKNRERIQLRDPELVGPLIAELEARIER